MLPPAERMPRSVFSGKLSIWRWAFWSQARLPTYCTTQMIEGEISCCTPKLNCATAGGGYFRESVVNPLGKNGVEATSPVCVLMCGLDTFTKGAPGSFTNGVFVAAL